MSALPDFSSVFAKYEALRGNVDALFNSIAQKHSDCMRCAEGCSDCCHALFDLSLVEALYINQKFQAGFNFGQERSDILQRADEADRKAFKFKKKIFKDSQAGRDSNEILQDVSRLRLRCPLLGDDDHCRLYDFRPLTCRIYGVPTDIGGDAHCCGKSAFQPGSPYPTVALDAVNGHLHSLSKEIAELLLAQGGRHKELHQVFVPLSMALMTNYDEVYLGLKAAPGKK